MLVKPGPRISLLLTLLLAIPVLCLAADEITVSASVDMTRVGLDDQFTYTITVDGAARGVEVAPLPRLEGLSVLSGPSVGQQSSFSMVGGSFEQKSVLTHSYRMLPEKTGTFTIPSVAVTHDGKTYQTGDVTVQVVKGSQQQNRTPASPFDRRPPGRSGSGQLSRKVFVKAVTPKQRVYQGEALPLEFRVYTQYDVGGFGFQKDPRFEGFWVEKVEGQPMMENTTVSGEAFGVFPAYRYVLYPTSPGEYTIESQTLGINVISSDRFSFFDRQQQIFRRTDPVELQVLPLPPDPPEAFGGAVGAYEFDVRLSSDQAATGDAVTLRLTVSGTGNLRGLSSPELPPLPDFRVYDPETADDLQLTDTGIRGSRTWEYVIVPRAPGRQTVPPVTFAWFSPADGGYRRQTSEELVLEVTQGEAFDEGSAAASSTSPEAVARKDVELVEQDIAFIRAVPAQLVDQAAHRHRAPWFLLLLILPALVNLAALLMVRVRRRSPAALAAQRRRRALRTALARVAAAGKTARGGDASGFYSGLDQALKGFIAHRFDQPGTAGITLDVIGRLLEDHGVSEELSRQLVEILEICDFAQFAPADAGSGEEMKSLAARARAVLKALEQRL
jgi:hypothetical protein